MREVAGSGISEVCREYQLRFCTTMSRGALDDIKALYQKGAEPDLMILAIEKAVQKGAPWSYAKAILDRCIEEKIFTKETFEYRANFKKVMNGFKRKYPHGDESLLLLFTLIEIGRDYIAQIEKGIAEWEASGEPFDINDYVEADENESADGC